MQIDCVEAMRSEESRDIWGQQSEIERTHGDGVVGILLVAGGGGLVLLTNSSRVPQLTCIWIPGVSGLGNLTGG